MVVTLWPIAEDARAELERGEHVFLKSPDSQSGVVLAFEEHLDDSYDMLEWEVDNSWRRIDSRVQGAAEEVVAKNRMNWVDKYMDGDESALKYGVGMLKQKMLGYVDQVDARVALETELDNVA